ncbi:MAG: 5'-methylthioadenosine/S-adenosylhomocysteine nucleosidase [Clostridia bacterium]|nr:5'-methylthioadenosine/S-adenosylhomocysteine nucleosidase [Clostridia bacterium]
MRYGLLIAVERELKAFLESGEAMSEERVCGRTVYRTRIGGHEIFALCSGCGEIDAAGGTQLLIAKYDCQAILNFGVTGALDPTLRVEDLFVVRKVRHYDFDTSAVDDLMPNQYADLPDAFIPLNEEMIRSAKAAAPALREAVCASGDKFIADREEKTRLFALGCQICDMEMAAIARVCRTCGVPCLSIKCISDTFEGGAGDFNTNVARSAGAAFRVLRAVLENGFVSPLLPGAEL